MSILDPVAVVSEDSRGQLYWRQNSSEPGQPDLKLQRGLRFDSAFKLLVVLLVLLAVSFAAIAYTPGASAIAILCSALLIICACTGHLPNRYISIDGIVVAISLLYIGDGIRNHSIVGNERTLCYLMSVSIYWLLRSSSVATVNLILAVLASTAALVSVSTIGKTVSWVARLQARGFQEPALMKRTMVSVLHGSMDEWATVVLLGMVCTLCFLSVRGRFSSLREIVSALGAVIALIALFLTFSCGVYFALVVFVLTLTVCIISCMRQATRALVVFYGIVGAAYLCSIVLSNEGVLANVHMSEYQRRIAEERLDTWSTAFDLFRQEPIFGSGLATFATRMMPNTGSGSYHPPFGRPPNGELGILVEEGLVGFSLDAAFVVGLVGVAIGSLRRAANRSIGADTNVFRTAILFSGLMAFVAKETAFSSYSESPLVCLSSWIWLLC